MFVTRRRSHFMAMTIVGLILLGGCVVGLNACGGSSALKIPTERGRQTPSQSDPDVGSASAQAQSGGPARVDGASPVRPMHGHPGAQGSPDISNGSPVERARPTPDSTNDDESPTGAQPTNPCKLVSLSEAQTITNGSVAGTVDAPLGPTCVYKLANGSGDITLTVESLNVSQISHRMARPQTMNIAGHQAYCGTLGKQMLFVPLGQYQVLNVTAPCSIAQRFATQALSHLTA